VTTTRHGGVEDRNGQRVDATRRGAHRARPTALEMVLPSLAVLGVVAIVATVTWVLLGKGLPGSTSTSAADGSTTSASPTASSSAKPSGAGSSSSGKPGAATSTAAAGLVNHRAPLRVLNATATTGLAKLAAQALAAKGWLVVKTGNFGSHGAVTRTTVYYSTPSQVSTAVAIASQMGAVTAIDAAVANSGITVVLGPDYKP